MTPEEKKRRGIPLWAFLLFVFACMAASPFSCWWVPLGQARPEPVAHDCRSQLKLGWKYLRYYIPETEKDEAWTPPPDWTVQDLVLETDYPLFMSCPVHFLPENSGKKKQGYLVFPVAASVVFDESLQPPVPIVMDLPGAHEKFGTNVLYSDGTIKILTKEEAEKLVSEQSPVPLKPAYVNVRGEDGSFHLVRTQPASKTTETP